MANEAAKQVWQWPYSAFGDNKPSGVLKATVKKSTAGIQQMLFDASPAEEVNLRMPGQYVDSETGQFYNYLRQYDSKTGKYIQPDPIGMTGGLSRFAYANGNAIQFVDPKGQVSWSGTVGSAGAIDGAGAALFTFDLTSECKCRKKVRIKGYVSTLAAGAGVKYTANASPASFSDIFPCPDAKQANGWAGAISVTAVPGVGASYGAMTMGHLKSPLSMSGPLFGVDISAGVFVGRSVVTSVEIKTCEDCEAK